MVNLEVPHFSTAAPLSATRRTFQPPFTYPFALLLVARMLGVINGIFGWGLWAQNRDGLMLKLTIGGALVSLPLNFVLIPRFGLLGASGVCVICETLMLLVTVWASRTLLLKSDASSTPGPKAAKSD